MDTQDTMPQGTVTFLFTDIEGSTTLWEHDRDAMRAAVERHIALLAAAISEQGGVHFKTVGDAIQAAFHTAPAAITAAVAAQRALVAEHWSPETGPLRVRMALHAGGAQPAEGDYLAPALNRLARMLSTAHGGQIVVSEAVRGLASGDLPSEFALRSLGPHRLRDLQEPETIYQVVTPDLAEHFPPLRSLPHHPTNLGIPPTPLIDREQEAATATRLLRENATRVLTFVGPGGSGKTRLAIEVAAELLDAFPDGVFFVDLSAVHDARLVAGAIAQALGVREMAGQDLDESIRAFLVHKHLLLVLDNVEQVLDAAPALARWLAHAPSLALLITSREPLRIRGEQVLPLEPFGLPDDTSGLTRDDIARIPAVALFVERATASNPVFELTAENAETIVAICRRLDGLPLAIELGAARMRSLTPAALLQRLERRLPVLAGGARDLPRRQQTLRDTIAWSHDLLEEPEKVLMRRLAVFSGGATLESLEAIADPEGSLDLLLGIDRLVEQSLLRLDERHGEPRYSMLETIREFGGEQLAASGEEASFRDRHALHMLEVAEEGGVMASPGEEVDPEWIARMERERENVRAAFSWRLQQGDAAGALRLGAAAASFWGWTNRWTEGRLFLEQALALGAKGEAHHLARVVSFAGGFAFAQGDSSGAVSLLAEGLTLPRTAETRPWVLRIVLKLAQAFGQLRDFTEAMRHYEQALHLASVDDDWRTLLEVRWSMAYTATSQGSLERARELAEAVLVDERSADDPLVVAGTKELLAWIALAANDLDRASAMLLEAREAAERAPSWADGLRVNLQIDGAVLAYRQDDLERAREHVAALLPAARAVNAQLELVFALLMLASIAAHRGRMAEAARWFGALSAALTTGNHWLHHEPAIRPWHEADVALVRDALGSTEFDRLWAEGRKVPLDVALGEAEAMCCPADEALPMALSA